MAGKAKPYGSQNGDFPVTKPRSVEEKYDAPFLGYINLPLSEEQRTAFSTWFSGSSFADSLDAFAADGINFSLKFDPKSHGFMASATQRRVGSPNAGYCVTARARDATTALGRVVFCVVILSHGERWTDVQPAADPDRW